VELHCRAAVAQDQPLAAIDHYLAAGAWTEAAQTIEAVAGQLFHQGLLDTLAGWIRDLPPAVRDAHSRLTWYLGNIALLKGPAEVSRPLLEQALQALDAAGDEAGQSGVLAQLATDALLQAEFARAEALIHRALAQPAARHTLVQLLMGRAWLALYQNRPPPAQPTWKRRWPSPPNPPSRWSGSCWPSTSSPTLPSCPAGWSASNAFVARRRRMPPGRNSPCSWQSRS